MSSRGLFIRALVMGLRATMIQSDLILAWLAKTIFPDKSRSQIPGARIWAYLWGGALVKLCRWVSILSAPFDEFGQLYTPVPHQLRETRHKTVNISNHPRKFPQAPVQSNLYLLAATGNNFLDIFPLSDLHISNIFSICG